MNLHYEMLLPNHLAGMKIIRIKDDIELRKERFRWTFQDWTECSVTCGKGG